MVLNRGIAKQTGYIPDAQNCNAVSPLNCGQLRLAFCILRHYLPQFLPI